MSRAFVKGADDNQTDELPERPLPAHPNYVTPRGLEQLQARLRELRESHEKLAHEDGNSFAEQRRQEVERDLRYIGAQIERAIVVDPAGQPHDEVHFGATVTIRDGSGRDQRFAIIGDDEADIAAGKISWASPLAKALIGLHVGDTALWHKPGGAAEIEVVAIDYPGAV